MSAKTEDVEASVVGLRALAADLNAGKRFAEVAPANGRGIRIGEYLAAQIEVVLASHAAQAERIASLEDELRVALNAYAGIIDLGGKLDLLGSNLELVESAHARVAALLSGKDSA